MSTVSGDSVFKIATVGCGNMASMAHGPSYARYAATHPGTTLAACCDLDPAKAERFRARFGFARTYTDLESMLDAERPDAVCLVAPVERTCALSCRILAKGYPLLMEKPPGQEVAEIDRMIAAAEKTGAPTQAAFNRRYTPLLVQFRGRLTGLSLQHVRCEFTRVGRNEADFSTTAIHGLDAVRFVADSDYAALSFRYQPIPGQAEGVANCYIDGTMASGAAVHLAFCPMAGEVVERYAVQAADHSLFAHLPIWNSADLPGRLRHVERNTCILDTPCPVAAAGPDDMFVANGFYGENAAFFDALRGGKAPAPDLRAVRQSVEIAQAIRERRPAWG